MKTKFSTSVFLGWATLFLTVLILDSSAAWYELTQAAREKLEWDAKTIKCVIETKNVVTDETNITISWVSVEVEDKTEYENDTEPGEKTICVNGNTFADCSDILGFWDSWDREGDCIPMSSEDE